MQEQEQEQEKPLNSPSTPTSPKLTRDDDGSPTARPPAVAPVTVDGRQAEADEPTLGERPACDHALTVDVTRLGDGPDVKRFTCLCGERGEMVLTIDPLVDGDDLSTGEADADRSGRRYPMSDAQHRCDHGLTVPHVDDSFLSGERVECPGPGVDTPSPEPQTCNHGPLPDDQHHYNGDACLHQFACPDLCPGPGIDGPESPRDPLMLATVWKCSECNGVALAEHWQRASVSALRKVRLQISRGEVDPDDVWIDDEMAVCPRCKFEHHDDESSWVAEAQGLVVGAEFDE